MNLTTAHSSVAAVPPFDVPDPVADASRRLRGYRNEVRTLNESKEQTRATSSVEAIARRADAVALLAVDARRELEAAIAEHKDTWRAAMAALSDEATRAYRQAIDTLDTTRYDVIVATCVADWLDKTGRDLSHYVEPGQWHISSDRPWSTVLAALIADATGEAPPARALRRLPTNHRFVARSLSDATAVIPDLARPAALDAEYQRHHELLTEHAAASTERNQAEATRDAVIVADRRALADAIANGEPDPGDANAETLEATLTALDARRATLASQVADSYATLRQLVDQHRGAWRTDMSERLDRAVAAYREAITDLTSARHHAHQLRQAIGWLDSTRPTTVAKWRWWDQPYLAGEPWDVTARLLSNDDAARANPLALTATSGGDAA